MKPEIAKIWIEALRSGKYEQTTEKLNHDGAFCCLGVLCDLHRKAVPEHAWDGDEYCGEDANLPDAVAQWAGMAFNSGAGDAGKLPGVVYLKSGNYGQHLAVLNDDGGSFKEIADIIEKHKDAL